jgi:hypothetical protein
MELYMSKREMTDLLAEAVRIGVEKGLENTGEAPKYVSQSRAYKLFCRSRVNNWVSDGLIVPKPNGNGKTSTVFYEYARLLELDASDRIIVRKAYISEKLLKQINGKS